MNLTSDTRSLVLEMARVYADRFSIPHPRVVMSTREVLDLPKHITRGRRTTAYKYYGVAYIKHNTIFINVKKIGSRKNLEKTLVHEIAHLRFPYMSHGTRFYSIIQRGLAGERFRPYRRRR